MHIEQMKRFFLKWTWWLAPVLLPQLTMAASPNAEQMYRSFCASCHASDMSGGLGPALNSGVWKHGGTDADLVRIIKKGVPKRGMPAWEKSLSDEAIRALVVLIRERTYEKRAAPAASQTEELTAVGYTFKLEKVAEAPSELWSMDFLPDGRMIAAQTSGPLWVFDHDGKRREITGTPKVWNRGQGGLLQVQSHPDASGWVYLTYADPATKGAMTKIVRGKIKDAEWVEQQTIYNADAAFYTDAGEHFPKWRNHLLVGSLAKEQLRLLRIDGDRVVADELVFQGRGRIRDVANGPDGYPYVVMGSSTGAIYRLVPKP